MITFEIRTGTPGSEQRCIKRYREGLERDIARILPHKADKGSNRSELGYQRIAASVSGRLARELGCNEDLAAALSMAAGMCFPNYGHAGLKAVKQYILDRNIDIDLKELEIITVCCYFSRINLKGITNVALAPFYYPLRDYFHGVDSCEEIRIVRLVQETIMDVKITEAFYAGNPGDLLLDVSDELIKLAKENKALTKGTLLDAYWDKISTHQLPQLTEAEKQGVYDRLDALMKELTNRTGEMACWNHTPEEVVVKYITSYD